MSTNTLQLPPPGQLAPTLQALHEHYEKLASDYEQLAGDARAKLEHVEALLNEAEAAPIASLSLPTGLNSKIEIPPATTSLAKATSAKDAKGSKTSAKSAKAEPLAKSPKSPKGKPAAKPIAEVATVSSKGSTKLRFQKAYQGNTLISAIEKVLQERQGEVVSADNVVQTLYGDLKADQFKVAKERITKSLSKGKIEGKWDRVPDKLGCYTLSLGSLG